LQRGPKYKEDGVGFFPNLSHVNVVNPRQVCDPKLAPLPLTTYIV